jgi:class 3 adenylate cyclase/tetratricopeptide (TPR) repeat protein
MNIGVWLRNLGLERYETAFRENEVAAENLPKLTADDLKEIGVTAVAHRRVLLEAIVALREGSTAKVGQPPSQAQEIFGRPPLPDQSSARAERRQLTVMFCDLVGSTALSSRLDPEDLRGIINTYHRCCAEMVERNGGFVAKYMGDGVLAYFGYPRAHEYDAERAVQAGLGLVEAVPKLATAAGSPLQVRVGIATGLVVVGDLIGAGAAQEQAVVGETPNLAARLQALADPSAVVISSSTRRLTGGLFEYRDLGAVALKGFTENVPIWQVLRASSAESRFEALRGSTTPLVGRGEETELLMRRWEQAKRGDGCVVLVSGEPGIGKSRIAETLLERLSGEPHTRLRSFCSPHHQDSALYPTITQLERAASFRRDDTAEQRLDKLEAVLIQGTNNLGHDALLLAELLSIPTGSRCPPLNLTPEKRKEKTLHALVAQVERLAAQQPVLMVVEDVHWVDLTSLELLDLIIERVPGMAILLIITFRPEFTARWVGRSHVTLVSLNRLPPRQRAEMIERVTGGKALPREIADQIIERTDGIPLFVEELTKAVVESGVLTDAGARYTLTGPLPPQAIPTTLHASLLARLDRLASVREVAQVGAALGRQFSHELISALATMPQQQLDDGLVQLVSAELIYRRGTPPDAEYTFKHALVQDAAYGTMLRSRRQQLHARIAATLEDQFPEIMAAQPALLAQHCAEAGFVKKAVGYWLKAGQQALGRSAMTEAVAQLQKGLALLSSLPNGPWHQQQELDLQIVLGPALVATKGYSTPDAGETIARARALAEQLNRLESLVPLLLGQWGFHLLRSEHKLALSVAEQIEKIGETQNEVAAQFQGRQANGLTRCVLGEFVVARALLEQCYGLGDPVHRTVGGGGSENHYATMLANLALTLAYLGFIDQAQLRMNEALSEARRLTHAYTVAVVLSFANFMWSLTCSAAEVQRYAEELLALSTEHGLALYVGRATAFHGSSLTARGQAQEGLTLLTQGLAATRATGCVLWTPVVLMWLAEAYSVLGQPLPGLNCLAEATQIIETTEERVHEAELHRLRGDLLNATGDPSSAERNYHQALGVAKRQSAKLLELRASISLARLWRDQGKRPEAHGLLASIYNWFTEGFDTPVLQDAKTLLDELNGPPTAGGGGIAQ